ncbi:4'-phosphopantetheinyl transferase superfamily protein [Streptomyces sp. ISL-22]|uniref:4'-phosphopantetheinyl transferase superfamily protein n=1 Tax=unclassified Streptomyces TaxID=2593676 RepID=UPI001BE686EA|nr:MULTISPECIES: 4'-phosphopantetheinyl transferase superfamily protein [unclassified Streptomyces]MBT2418867.1 4'-phosphopantetheinyl transferase superfamily protein [Streptomyces sp. ISL-24]MBT2435700.1 4'-phosphopantetheinyl transferase superfamily protein [Streptomyces sp. ISL-22]
MDLVDLARFERAVDRCGDSLAFRYFTAHERRIAKEWATEERSAAEVLAHFFGVKESVVKLMGGLPAAGRLADISVAVPDGGWGSEHWTVHLSGPLAPWSRSDHGIVGASARLEDGLALAWAAAPSEGGAP